MTDSAPPPPYPSQFPQSPPTDPIETLSCARCGYLLRGLAGVARCPECGLEIDQSLAAMDLARSNPLWVGRLATGAWLLALVSVVVLARSVMMSVRSIDDQLASLRNFLYYAALAVEWTGWWLLTTPRPARVERFTPERDLRWWTRAAVVATAAMHLLGLSRLAKSPNLLEAQALLQDACSLAVIVLINSYLRQLARRLPDAFLIRHLPILMTIKIITVVLFRLLPDVGAVVGSRVLQSLQVEWPLPTIIACGMGLYGAYILIHLWKRFRSAADTSVVNWNAHATTAPL